MKTQFSREQLPKPARKRKIPPDQSSLEAIIRATHRRIAIKVGHLKAATHDIKAQRALLCLLGQRRDAWQALRAKNPVHAQKIADELNLFVHDKQEEK